MIDFGPRVCEAVGQSVRGDPLTSSDITGCSQDFGRSRKELISVSLLAVLGPEARPGFLACHTVPAARKHCLPRPIMRPDCGHVVPSRTPDSMLKIAKSFANSMMPPPQSKQRLFIAALLQVFGVVFLQRFSEGGFRRREPPRPQGLFHREASWTSPLSLSV